MLIMTIPNMTSSNWARFFFLKSDPKTAWFEAMTIIISILSYSIHRQNLCVYSNRKIFLFIQWPGEAPASKETCEEPKVNGRDVSQMDFEVSCWQHALSVSNNCIEVA
jgi:hypothetical protein